MRLKDLIERKGFVKIVELMPLNLENHVKVRLKSLLNQARLLSKVSDALQLADIKGPKQINPVLTAVELKRLLNVETIPTIPLRDYNKRGFIGLALSALLWGLENLFIVRGDPYRGDELTYDSNVYGFKKVSEAVKEVSNLMKVAGIRATLLAPIDLDKLASEEYRDVIKERAESGVDVFLTQPFFGNIDNMLEGLDLARSIGVDAYIVFNIFPLKSLEDALRCEARFGWKIPKRVKEGLKDGGLKAAFKFARNWYLSLLENRVDGVYLSSRGDADLALRILS